MIRNAFLTYAILATTAFVAGCSQQPTVRAAAIDDTVHVAAFGDAVREVIDSQIHDFEAALHPTPEAVGGSDPDRLNNALEIHRSAVTEPQQVQRPISISVGP